ncbi:DUF2201 family putative metallopeptidase [Desulfobotulus sp.]|jgi:predicted metal-dependent peptidase|uniref:DUF2201 family putative metallopeptidase n=1 Tax=Desulfobotulus sp. TaxID=1940337 RepID=UPI002A361AA4|nr:hypothetical protein [Desulfobotulus sp.]MDY0163963.1 hypothetical protein [Desulfobotulus sp.]
MKSKQHPAWEAVLEDLWRQSRFTSYFYQSVQFTETSTVPTLALSMGGMRPVLLYHPDFVDSQDKESLKALLVHELLHLVHGHDHRHLKDHEPYLQNLAQDMVINSFLRRRSAHFFSCAHGTATDLRLPADLPGIPDAFFEETGESDPSWERVYQWFGRRGPEALRVFSDAVRDMFRDLKKPPQKKAPHTGPCHVTDSSEPDAENPDLIPEGLCLVDKKGKALPTGTHLFLGTLEKRQLQSQIRRIMDLAKDDPLTATDRVFEALSRMMESIEKLGPLPWERRLRSLLDRNTHSNEWLYTKSRFNRRYLPHGIYTSGRIFREKELLTVCVDVSSSMTTTPGEMARAFAVVESLLDRFRVNLLCVDEKVFIPRIRREKMEREEQWARPYFYKKGDWKHLETGNSGTTFFAPLFNAYMRNHKELLLVLTDGHIHDMGKLNPYPATLWLISSGRREAFHAPFGKALILPAMGKNHE